MTPAIGQIWREVDPHSERYVRIENTPERAGDSVGIRTVAKVRGQWVYVPGTRLTYANAGRFNGARDNYAFFCEPLEVAR